MVSDVNQTYYSDYFTIYTNSKSLCCLSETNIICQLYFHLKKYLDCTMLMCVPAMKKRVPHTFHGYLILDQLMHQPLTIKTTGLRVTVSLKTNFTYLFSSIACQFPILTYRRQSHFPFYHVLRAKFIGRSQKSTYTLLPMPESPQYLPP